MSLSPAVSGAFSPLAMLSGGMGAETADELHVFLRGGCACLYSHTVLARGREWLDSDGNRSHLPRCQSQISANRMARYIKTSLI